MHAHQADHQTVTTHAGPWWRSAVVYQIYIRSFADGDGDGNGDIAGMRARLRYLADLGVDALWINPWYPSPMADGGYDVADYRDVARMFGTIDEAEALVREAHALDLRVLLDIVPNHTSHLHPWFQAALAAGAGSPERDRYLFRPGRGPGGDKPPNNWRSQFGGQAWTRVTEPDGSPGEWYLHLFAPQQPDLNWHNAEVRADFEATLRFWFDRGVDGFRVDVAHSLFKQEGLPDVDNVELPWGPGFQGEHPHWDREEVHDVYRGWRAVADRYDPPRVFVAEAWVGTPERLARYVRRDELHTAFSFDFLLAPWRADTLRTAIDLTLAEHAAVEAPAVWVLSNHDVARHASRYARDQHDVTGHSLDDIAGRPADAQAGLRRARAAALLMLALPGSVYLYQGEELGLPEVEDLPDDALTDPTWERTGRTVRGRDGCRVPLPWSGTAPPFGFSVDGSAGAGAAPWLPQPPHWRAHTVTALDADPDSILNLYRAALRLRRELPALGDGTLQWLDAPAGALVFAREPDLVCAVNFGPGPLRLPGDATVLLSSDPLTDRGALPPDTAAWLRTAR
ncbi:MAG TPA: glycoside hydrolase family 13 protein [Euzebyales bacterium]|nr:glycoside hydrolase family 13 protein [Euzebyales bacterium]